MSRGEAEEGCSVEIREPSGVELMGRALVAVRRTKRRNSRKTTKIFILDRIVFGVAGLKLDS